MTTKNTTAATLAERLEANRDRQEEIRGRLSELDEAVEANEAERGAVTARGGDASKLRAEGRALEDEATDLRNAMAHLEGEASRLEGERATAERSEAGAAYEAAKTEADKAMGALRAMLLAFAEETFLPAAERVDAKLEAMKQAGKAVRRAGGDVPLLAGSSLWTRHKPVQPILGDLRKFAEGKAIIRARAPMPPAPDPADVPLAFK